MTIAAGFRCLDGVVLCADTQETVQDYIKRHQPKLEVRPFYPQIDYDNPDAAIARAVFAGAGDGDFIDHLVEKLWDAMKGKAKTIDTMVDALEDELIREYQKLTPAYHPGQMPEVAFLIGLCAESGQMELVKLAGPILKRRLFLEAIGFGTILSTYLLSRTIHPKSMTSHAIPFAVYMIDQVKEHVKECGGETHLLVLKHDGQIEEYGQQQIQELSGRLKEIDEVARSIWDITSTKDFPESAFDATLSMYMDRLREIRQSISEKSVGQP